MTPKAQDKPMQIKWRLWHLYSFSITLIILQHQTSNSLKKIPRWEDWSVVIWAGIYTTEPCILFCSPLVDESSFWLKPGVLYLAFNIKVLGFCCPRKCLSLRGGWWHQTFGGKEFWNFQLEGAELWPFSDRASVLFCSTCTILKGFLRKYTLCGQKTNLSFSLYKQPAMPLVNTDCVNGQRCSRVWCCELMSDVELFKKHLPHVWKGKKVWVRTYELEKKPLSTLQYCSHTLPFCKMEGCIGESGSQLDKKNVIMS